MSWFCQECQATVVDAMWETGRRGAMNFHERRIGIGGMGLHRCGPVVWRDEPEQAETEAREQNAARARRALLQYLGLIQHLSESWPGGAVKHGWAFGDGAFCIFPPEVCELFPHYTPDVLMGMDEGRLRADAVRLKAWRDR